MEKTEASILNNVKSFWSYVKKLNKCDSLPNSMYLNDVNNLNNPQSMAEAFQSHFCSVYRTGHGAHLPRIDSDFTIDNFILTEADIHSAIKNLDDNINPGPDGVYQPFLLRNSRLH